MLKSEVATLLGKAALIDNRRVDPMLVEAWWEILTDVEFEDAMAALTRHRRESTEYLMPGHIVAGAKRARSERVTEEQRQRALTAGPAPRPSPAPEWFREFLNNYGKNQTEEADQ